MAWAEGTRHGFKSSPHGFKFSFGVGAFGDQVMCRRKSSVVTQGDQISSAIAAGLTRPHGCEFRQQCAGSPTRTQQGRIGEHGDALSAISRLH